MSRIPQDMLDRVNATLPDQEPQRALWYLPIGPYACGDPGCTGGHEAEIGVALRPDGSYLLTVRTEANMRLGRRAITLSEDKARLILSREQLIDFISDCQEAVNLGGG